jgi:hypothetical protein
VFQVSKVYPVGKPAASRRLASVSARTLTKNRNLGRTPSGISAETPDQLRDASQCSAVHCDAMRCERMEPADRGTVLCIL